MRQTKNLIDEAKEQSHRVKQLVIKLLSEPMANDQKEIVLELYRLVK